jgi:hypothetical protein
MNPMPIRGVNLTDPLSMRLVASLPAALDA